MKQSNNLSILKKIENPLLNPLNIMITFFKVLTIRSIKLCDCLQTIKSNNNKPENV